MQRPAWRYLDGNRYESTPVAASPQSRRLWRQTTGKPDIVALRCLAPRADRLVRLDAAKPRQQGLPAIRRSARNWLFRFRRGV
jgi:hypothetical protein